MLFMIVKKLSPPSYINNGSLNNEMDHFLDYLRRGKLVRLEHEIRKPGVHIYTFGKHHRVTSVQLLFRACTLSLDVRRSQDTCVDQ